MKTILMRGKVWSDYDYSLAIPVYSEAAMCVACNEDLDRVENTYFWNNLAYQEQIERVNNEDEIMHCYYRLQRENEEYKEICRLVGWEY